MPKLIILFDNEHMPTDSVDDVSQRIEQIKNWPFVPLTTAPIRIGRSADGNDIRLPSSEITRNHATISQENDRYWINFSLKGVRIANSIPRVNGVPIRGPTRLAHGDTILIGCFPFWFDDDEPRQRSVVMEPHWLTATVLDVARTIREKLQFERMPILADALMDAGCDSDEIIDHCQGTGPHVRGCWVVDLVLGKEQLWS